MNKNFELICGKKGLTVDQKKKMTPQNLKAAGLLAMSVKEIKDLITSKIAGNELKQGLYKRLKSPKRLELCAFMRDHMKDEWSKYSKGKAPAGKPTASPEVAAPFRELMASLNGMNFGIEEEEPMEVGNGANEEEGEGGNYANSGNEGRMVFPTAVPRGSRKANKDPLKGVMLSKGNHRRLKKKLGEMMKAGEDIPAFNTQYEMLKFLKLMKPGEMLKPKGVQKKPMASKNLRYRVKLMAMPTVPTPATGRVARDPRVVVPTPGTRLSDAEIKKATEKTEKLTDRLMKVGQTKNFIKKVISTTAPVDANALTNSLMALESFNRNSVRGVIRAKVFQNMGAPIARPPPKNLPPGFSMVAPISIAELAKMGRNKKAAERTAEEKRAMNAMKRFAAIRARGRRRTRAKRVTVSNQPVTLASPSGSNTDSARSTRTVRMMGSASSSNSNSNNGMKLNQPVVKVKGATVMVNNANVNQMNNAKLKNAARRLLAAVRPGQTVNLNQTNDMLRRMVKAIAKKMTAKSK